jgi:transcription elongation GreA/GreB family factor
MNSVPQPPAAAVFETRQVQIGDTVTFKYVNELMPRHVKIVPMGQPCDRANGIIWPKDPLALALLGFCVGDKPDVLLPTGSREAEILEIQYRSCRILVSKKIKGVCVIPFTLLRL